MNRPYYPYYPNYYPTYAMPNVPPPPNPQPMNSQPAQQPAPQQPIMQSGFVSVQSEQEAKSYPVAPGNSITFKDENSPYCYVKTMGFSQLDRPTFEKYRLVKEGEPVTEENAPIPQEEPKTVEYATKEEFEQLRAEFGSLKGKVAKMKENRVKKRVEVVDEDDDE